MSNIFWLRIAGLWGFLAVAMGAFGAHGLKDRLASLGTSATFETASQYHMYHALALLGVAVIVGSGRGATTLTVAGWSFVVGSLIFSGSLYILSVTGLKWLGAITPIGGVILLIGWGALFLRPLLATNLER